MRIRRSVLGLALLCLLARQALPDAVPVVQDSPRLVFRPEGTKGFKTFETARKTARADRFATQAVDGWLQDEKFKARECAGHAAMRWILTQKKEDADHAVKRLFDQRIKNPMHQQLPDLYEVALAYDWLASAGLLDDAQRKKAEDILAKQLDVILGGLGRPGPSLWHRWTTGSNQGMICALALRVHPKADEYRKRMLPLYRMGLEALKVAEAWPGGYPYWIGNRSIPFACAALCWHSATGSWKIDDLDIREIIRTTGYWHMYALRPDSYFIRYGDIFFGVDPDYFLQQPPHDFFATVTEDPHLAAFADHFRDFTGKGHPYRRAFAWYIPFAYPAELPRPDEYSPERKLLCLEDLPQARVFGRGATGLAIMRKGGWGADSTHVTFKAGHAMAHHGHWVGGNFTIFKHAPLAVLSGMYGGYDKDARVGYYIRSISGNTLLVRKPGEITDRKRPQYNDGGQRLVFSTGSAISTLAEWREKAVPGKEYYCSEIVSFASEKDVFDYVAADLTAAYNSTVYSIPEQKPKVSRVMRQMLYIREPEAILTVDTVEKTDPSYRSKWLLHSFNKAETRHEKTLVGDVNNGILESRDPRAVITNGDGRLVADALFPREHRWLKIGGRDYCFFVEKDTNDRNTFDGRNMTDGHSAKALRRNRILWRMELEPLKDEGIDRFAVLMHIGSKNDPMPKPVPRIKQMPDGVICVRRDDDVIFVADYPAGKTNRHDLILDPTMDVKRVFLVGFPAGMEVVVTRGEKSVSAKIPEERACVREIGD
jgi:hypothetical protein